MTFMAHYTTTFSMTYYIMIFFFKEYYVMTYSMILKMKGHAATFPLVQKMAVKGRNEPSSHNQTS